VIIVVKKILLAQDLNAHYVEIMIYVKHVLKIEVTFIHFIFLMSLRIQLRLKKAKLYMMECVVIIVT